MKGFFLLLFVFSSVACQSNGGSRANPNFAFAQKQMQKQIQRAKLATTHGAVWIGYQSEAEGAVGDSGNLYQNAVARLSNGTEVMGDWIEVKGADLLVSGSPIVINGIVATFGDASSVVQLKGATRSAAPEILSSGASHTVIVSPPKIPRERRKWF